MRRALVITPDKKDVPNSNAAVLNAPSPAGSSNIDANCLESRKLQCDAVLVAPTTKGKVDLYGGCFPPCYRGPMPP